MFMLFHTPAVVKGAGAWGAPFSSKINKIIWVSQYASSDFISDKKYEFLPTTLHGYGREFPKE